MISGFTRYLLFIGRLNDFLSISITALAAIFIINKKQKHPFRNVSARQTSNHAEKLDTEPVCQKDSSINDLQLDYSGADDHALKEHDNQRS
ncbi:MAG TPA: hypothetical protein PLN83_11360 [Syntrophorhabdus sp.]|nr:hypothetical protein [Syntrophorhabdus sp.]